MAVTMRDVARAAQVDPSVVSAVLNGSRSIRVSQAKRERILNLVSEMKYRPNLTARGLITRKTFAIGVLAYSTRDRFYAAMMSELQQRLLVRGYAGIYGFWNQESEVEKAYDTVLSRGVDGIITTHDDPPLRPGEIPTVIYGGVREGYDCILYDFEDATCRTLRYLLDLGHRRIGLLGITPQDPRYPGFHKFLEEAGMELRPEWQIPCPGFLADAFPAAMELLKLPDRPSAVIARNDMAALAVLNAASRLGLSVPRDLSIVGFNNIEEVQYCFPAITTNGDDLTQLVEELIETLFHRMAHPDSPPTVRFRKLNLLIRESCAPPRKR